jgi:exosortase
VGTVKTLTLLHVGLFFLWAAIFFPLYPELIDTWLNDSNNSHGILVPFITAFFVWKKWPELKETEVKIDWRGALLLLTSLSVYIVSFVGGVAVAGRGMIVLSLMGLVLFNYGPAIFRKLAFPLFFLFFMIPVPLSVISLVSLPLQRLATDIAAFLISMVSIPVYQEGNMLYFSQTQLEVAEACSGIHSIMAMLMLGTLFVSINRMKLNAAILLLGATIPIAMIANVTRVTGTGILAHFYGARVARGFLHDFSGMAVFAFGLLLLLFVYWLIYHFFEDRQSKISA